MTKAQLYDEAVAKIGTITSLKLIHICVDYAAWMETILAEMRTLFTVRNRFFHCNPIPLEKVLDLIEFPDLPQAVVLQNLHTLTILKTNPKSSESGGRKDLGSDARSKDAGRIQPKEVLTPALDSTPPLSTEPTLLVPSPLAPSLGQVNPLSGLNLPPHPNLQEAARRVVEFMTRPTAFT